MFTILLKQFRKLLLENLAEVRGDIRESEALIRADIADLRKKLKKLEQEL